MTILLVFSVAVGIVAITFWKVARLKEQAAQNYAPQGAFVQVNGHPVHYIDMGSGPDLVLLHGASGNTREFTFGLAETLAQSYRVLIFDRPGLGHTPALAKKGVTLMDQAALLSRAAAQLGAEHPIVLGQSFGGAVAMAWAVHHPDQIAAVVSVAGATYPWEGPLNTFSARLAHPIKGPITAHLIAAWAPSKRVASSIESIFAPQASPQGYAEHIGLPVILQPASLIANAQQRHDLRAHLQTLHKHYPELDLPIEIVHGTADEIVGLEFHSTRMVQDIKGVHLTVLEGIGHMPHQTNPDAVLAAVRRASKRVKLQ